MTKRFFAFGCSFTAYSWPTWADLLSVGYSEYYNYGIAGIGNRAIAERIAEAHATHNFTKDDLVIVQWSTHLRNDWYNPKIVDARGVAWQTAGSLFSYQNLKLYDQKWFDTFFYEPAYLMHTYNNVLLVQNLLENTNCEYYMTSIGDLRNGGADLKDSDTFNENVIPRKAKTDNFAIWEDYPHLEEIYNKPIWEDRKDKWLEPIMTHYMYNCPERSYQWIVGNYPNNRVADELHPSTDQYYLWLKDNLLTKLNKTDIEDSCIDISNDTRSLYENSINNMASFERKLLDLKVTGLKWPNIPLGNLK